jgi:hypothetical protein
VAGSQGAITLGGVAIMGSGQRLGINGVLGGAHPSRGLQAADGPALLPTHQPVPSGHGGAVGQQRFVADDHGVALVVAHHHLEAGTGSPPEQFGDRLDCIHAAHQTTEPTSWVQKAHALASTGMELTQCGQLRVVDATSGSVRRRAMRALINPRRS